MAETETRDCIECLDPFEVQTWNGHPVHDRKRCDDCIKEMFSWR